MPFSIQEGEPSVMEELRVLVVADDPLTRAGLAALLSGPLGCTVVGQVTGDADLRTEVAVARPDVILWDLGWDPLSPATGSASSLERLADQVAEIDVPVVALVAEEAYTRAVWTAGARGLLPRDVDAEELAAALVAVVRGLVVLTPALAGALMPADHLPETRLVEALTPREREVLQLLAEGLPNKAIARRLGISEHTVKFHVNAILGKLGAQSRTEAVVRATRLGLIFL